MLRSMIVEFPHPGTRYCHNAECRVTIFYPRQTGLCPCCQGIGRVVKNLRYEVELGEED